MAQFSIEADHGRRPADEEEHRHPVEEALDRDGGQRRRLAYAVALLQDPGAHQLASPQGEDVIGGVANDHDREDVARRDVSHRAQQHVPAIGANGDPGVEQEQSQWQSAPIDPGERVADLIRMLPAQGKKEEEEANGDADPDARRPERRLARRSRTVAVGKQLHRRTGLRVSCLPRRSRSIRAGITSDDAGWSSKVVAAVSRCYYFSWNQASRGTWDHDPRSFVFKGRCKHAVAEMVVPAPWARGQTTFPTVRVNCAHEALRRRDVAVRHPATGPPIRRRPRKGALRA